MRLPARLALVATLACVAAPGAAAQAPAAAGPDPLAALRADALQPGSWTYRSTVERGGASVELARRTLTVRATEEGGVPAWLILDDTRARGQTMTDSLFVARADLRPLRRVADIGPLRIALAFPGDSVVGTMSVPGGEERPVRLGPGGRRVLVNSGMLEAALPLLPLVEGWTATVAQLSPGPLGVTVVPLALAVAPADSVTVPAGTFDAWLVTATAAGAEQRLWVARDTGRLLRQEAAPPGSDVVYRTELVAVGSAPTP